jgi:hypothetical protein
MGSNVSEHTEVPVNQEKFQWKYRSASAIISNVSEHIEVPVKWEEMLVNIQKCQ